MDWYPAPIWSAFSALFIQGEIAEICSYLSLVESDVSDQTRSSRFSRRNRIREVRYRGNAVQVTARPANSFHPLLSIFALSDGAGKTCSAKGIANRTI
jgi:hypothetical protein